MIIPPAISPAVSTLAAQVDAVHLLSAPQPAAEHWPVGYTMTVWGVAIGAVVLISLIVTTWMRLSPSAKALTVQTLAWRLSPRQLWALRSVATASGTPAAAMLVSRGAFESAVAAWAEGESRGGRVGPASVQRPLALLFERVHGAGPA